MNSNGGRVAGFGKRELYMVLALLSIVFAVATAMFAIPAWAQERQEPVSEAQKARIERLSDAEVEEQFVQTAQASNSSGDLARETATVNNMNNSRVIIEESGCTVDNGNATIVFKDDGKAVAVADGENSVDIRSNDRRVVVSGSGITSDNDPPTVLASTGIECGDPDNDDDFDDELLFLLLLELLDDDNGDGNDGDDGDDGDDDGRDGDDGDNDDDGFFDDDDDDQYDDDENGEDLDGDGDVDQDDELFEAESDLGEETDGEDTLGDDFDAESEGDDDGSVSASSDEDGAEASTPGASASAGGGEDPDEQAPVDEEQGDVVDEVPTSGPLPNTGGFPLAAGGTVLAMVLFGAGLLAVRLAMLWRGRRA